ncbi:MAG: NAD+ synthase [Candidatus Neomarinimicrobiota bacterium]|nr:MAG: NAD+ synthase [Candidatus Neomarinimicrobiota bacterium]
MKIALAQLNTSVGDLTGNTEKIIRSIHDAAEKNADLVVFPELTVPGYPPQDLIFEPGFVEKNLIACQKIAHETRHLKIASLVGYIDNPSKEVYHNAVSVISGGKMLDTVYKTLLPTYDVFDEKRYFVPATKVRPISCQIGGKSIKLGIEICEDLWDDYYDIKVSEELVRQGAEILINCSASPYSYGKFKKRKELVLNKVRHLKTPFCYVNLCGGQDELIFDGNSFMVDSRGGWLAYNGPFNETITCASIERNTKSEDLLSEPEILPDEELLQALQTGVRDYFYKTGFTDAVIGLSGGIDSALVAVIAAEALGPDHVWGILMPSRFSSAHSISDAQQLAQNLGIHHEIISIQSIFEVVLKTLEKQFKGTDFGLAEENIQARSRGIILMALANKFNRLVLTTGNKTELALGYSTLYGDMAGALAVISDLKKEDVYRLSRYINEKAGYDRIPQHILEKVPSAELREGQTDPFDYEIVSPLVEFLIEHQKSPEQLIQEGYDAELVYHLNRLIHLAEYKRRQAPPGLRVTEKSFGMGRRIPIVNKYMTKDQKL